MGRHRKKLHTALRRRVYARDDYTCQRCGWRPTLIPDVYVQRGWSVYDDGRHLELDHVVALALGGANVEGNLQVLCDGCNRVKGAA